MNPDLIRALVEAHEAMAVAAKKLRRIHIKPWPDPWKP